jgi:hypothetical protein
VIVEDAKISLCKTPSRRVFLGNSYPRSCIVPVLTGQNYLIAPTLSDPDSLHVVVMDGYAVPGLDELPKYENHLPNMLAPPSRFKELSLP